MSENKNKIEELLLLRYFSGETTYTENKEVEDWLLTSKENREVAENLYSIFFTTRVLESKKLTDGSKALIKVNKKIRSKKITLWTNRLQRIAAIFLIPLLFVTGYMLLHEPPVESIEIRTTPGMIAQFNLPDGSKVWLNSGSRIIYPSRFENDSRDINLIGEAYFEVSKKEASKFTVNTNKDIQIEVLGTEFNIEAYELDEFVATTLVSGSINLKYKTREGENQTVLMEANQKIVYNTNSKNIENGIVFTQEVIAWKDGNIILRNTPLDDVLRILGKRFNVDFIVKDESLKENYFTGTFDSQHLDKILEHIRLSSNINYRILESKLNNKNIYEKNKVELY